MISSDYVAGFIDGEGCISILKKKHKRKSSEGERVYVEYAANVNIANTNREILEQIRSQYGGVIYSADAKLRRPNRKPRFQLVMAHKAAYALCNNLKDRLLIKKPNAEIILKLRSTKSKEWRTEKTHLLQEKLYQDIKMLNQN